MMNGFHISKYIIKTSHFYNKAMWSRFLVKLLRELRNRLNAVSNNSHTIVGQDLTLVSVHVNDRNVQENLTCLCMYL